MKVADYQFHRKAAIFGEANNSNIYQGIPRGAGVQRNSDHRPNSEIVADLEGIKVDLLILQKHIEANSRSLSKIYKIKKKPWMMSFRIQIKMWENTSDCIR